MSSPSNRHSGKKLNRGYRALARPCGKSSGDCVRNYVRKDFKRLLNLAKIDKNEKKQFE